MGGPRGARGEKSLVGGFELAQRGVEELDLWLEGVPQGVEHIFFPSTSLSHLSRELDLPQKSSTRSSKTRPHQVQQNVKILSKKGEYREV